ncbi:hypothetical protein Tco_1208458 [Tanacetum coccineum]
MIENKKLDKDLQRKQVDATLYRMIGSLNVLLHRMKSIPPETLKVYAEETDEWMVVTHISMSPKTLNRLAEETDE